MTQQILMQSQQSSVSRTPLGHLIEIDINGEISEPLDWKEEICSIRDSGPNDVVHLRLVTPGGRLDTTLSFLSAMRQTQAHIICELVGPVASAGTIIFLSGNEFIVNDGVDFMIHTASGGAWGSAQQVSDQATHFAKQNTKLLKDTYAGFCSESEISDILKGVELWLDADQVVERLEKRIEYLEQKQQEEVEEVVAEKTPFPTREELEGLTADEILDRIFGEEGGGCNCESCECENSCGKDDIIEEKFDIED